MREFSGTNFFEKLISARTSPDEFQEMYDEILHWTCKYSTVVPRLKITRFRYDVIMGELDDVGKNASDAYSELLVEQKNFSGAILRTDVEKKIVTGKFRHKYKNFESILRKKESLEEFLHVKFIIPFDSTFLSLAKFESEHPDTDPAKIILDAIEIFYAPDILVVGIIENDVFDKLLVLAKTEKARFYVGIVKDLSNENFPIEEILYRVCDFGDFDLFSRIIHNVKFEKRFFWRLLRITNSHRNSPEHEKITDYLWREISIRLD